MKKIIFSNSLFVSNTPSLVQRWFMVFRATILTIVLALISGCTNNEIRSDTASSGSPTSRNPEDLFVVDCMLPGQVRQLGQNFTFIAARPAIKTTAFSCGLRGGEYTAYNRASYKTALNVWLPRAESGDADAQTYVGEIYEKGLGIAPDYERAAQWYEKAAKQGSSRAKINLGYLYEKGIGVDQNIPKALNWYRDASGIEDDELTFASTIEVETQSRVGEARRQIESLQQDLHNSRLESQVLRKKLSRYQSQINKERSKLNRALDELESARQKLKSSHRSQPGQQQSQQIQQYQKDLETAQALVLNERSRLKSIEVSHKNETEMLADKLESAERRANIYQQRLETTTPGKNQRELETIARRKQEAKILDAKLAKAENRLRTKLDQTLDELADTQRRFETLKSQPSKPTQPQLSQYQEKLDRQQAEILDKRAQLDAMKKQHKAEKSALRNKLESEQQRSSAYARTLKKNTLDQASLRKKLTTTEQQLADLNQRYDAEKSNNPKPSSQNKDLLAQINNKNQQLEQQKALSSKLIEEIELLAKKNKTTEAQLAQRETPRKDNTLSLQLSQTAQELQQHQRKINQLETENKNLMNERNTLQSSHSQLSTQQQTQLQSIQLQLAEQSRKLNIEKDETRLLVERIDHLTTENETLKNQISQSGSTANSSLQSIAAQLTTTTIDLKKQRSVIAKLEAEKQQIANQHKQLHSSHKQTVANKDAELKKLRSEIEQRESRRKQLESQLAQKQNNVPFIASAYTPPKIQLIDPPLSTTRGALSFKLRSAVRFRNITGSADASAGIMSFTINDRVETVNDAGLFNSKILLEKTKTPVNITLVDKKGGKAILNFVMVPGKKRGSSRKLPLKQNTPLQAASKIDFGSYHALLIGNEKYSHLTTLDTPIDDIRDIDKLLRSKYKFKTTVLTNANRYAILSALNNLRAKLNEKSNLLIYYAGHGEVDKVNQRGQWLPVDAEMDSTANWIPTTAITDIINTMTAKHVMVVADSCYSGAMTRASLVRLDPGMSEDLKFKWLKTMAVAKSRTVLTSGDIKPVLDSGADGHSIFARAFIKTLKKNQKILEGQSLYGHIAGDVRKAARRVGFEQSPQYGPIKHTGHESGDFFFVPRT